MWLTRLCLRRPVTLIMALVSVVVLGLISFGRLPQAFLPHVEFPFIGVMVPYSGGIPSEVEREIARPIEEVLATLGGIRELESYSRDDQAFVGVEFEWGRDVNALRMEVQEKVDQIRGDLPSDVRDIFLFTFNSNDIPIIEGRISAKGRDLSESYDLIEQRIIRPLQQVPGVGSVGIDGVNPTIGAIYLRLDRIQEFDVDVERLFRELSAANINLTVGQITDRGLRYDLRSVSNLGGMEALGNLPIDERGLRLSDIAELAYGAPKPRYGRHLNGEFAIAFWIQKASGHNTVEVCRGVERCLEEINLDPALQGVDAFTFFNQADQITNSIEGLWKAGLFGSLLSVVVLYVFLRRWSLTLLVSMSIPISILGTGIFLYLTGGSLNVLSMMGLMLGIGMLVDNAVVVLESIHRRRNLGASPVAAAIRGTRDVGRAIVASTLTTVIVFAPIIVTQKNELAVWLGSVGVAISVTIIGSLLVSLTVIPAFSVFMTNPGSADKGESRWIARLRSRYGRVLQWTTIRHPYWTGFGILPAIIVLTFVIGGITGNIKPDMESDEGIRQERLRMNFAYTGPVDRETSQAYVEKVEEYLETRREDLGLRDIYSFYAPDVAGMSLFFEQEEISPEFLAEVRDDLRENLPVQAGVEYRFGDEEGNDSGATRIQVTVSGEDTELLEELAGEVKRRISALDGFSDVTTDADLGHPEIQVAIDREKAGRHGVRANNIAQVLALTYRGTWLPRLNTGEKEIDLSISLLPDDTESIENLASMIIAVENDRPILLGQLADFRFERSPQTIVRRNQKTGVTVSAAWEGERTDQGIERVRKAMEDMDLPFGYGWNFGSRIQRAQEQQDEMGMNVLLAILCVFLVMASLFESLVHPGIVMGSILFAITGVLQFLMITATPLNIMAFIGIVILIGVVVNNGIVLVEHINHQRRIGMGMHEAIVSGCEDRLRPVLMTAGTTILGLLPLALSRAHMADAEYYPMARAIIGGPLSGTALTLLVLPTYYAIVNGWLAWIQSLIQRRTASPPEPQGDSSAPGGGLLFPRPNPGGK